MPNKSVIINKTKLKKLNGRLRLNGAGKINPNNIIGPNLSRQDENL